MPSSPEEKFTTAGEQRSWKLFERSLALASAQAFGADVTGGIYRDWIARYPDASSVYSRYFEFLTSAKQFGPAEALIADYRKAFPTDEAFPLRARASIARQQGSEPQAVAIYDSAFPAAVASVGNTESFPIAAGDAGPAKVSRECADYCYGKPRRCRSGGASLLLLSAAGQSCQAQRALLEYQARKQSFTAEELFILAKLFDGAHNYNEAARNYFALYNLNAAPADSKEKGLGGVIDILLTAPEQSIQIGAGDLSYYKDVATMDPYPGALNGFLSLLFNSTNSSRKFADQERVSVAYFHRAKASEFLAAFDTQFPKSDLRPRLHSKLMEAYAAYGDNDGVIRRGNTFLTSFPKASERTQVSLLIADAYARKNQVKEEFAVYDALLKELSTAADGMPLGSVSQRTAVFEPEPAGEGPDGQPAPTRGVVQAPAGPARSPAYAQVLDRYIARLVSLKRTKDALTLYRGRSIAIRMTPASMNGSRCFSSRTNSPLMWCRFTPVPRSSFRIAPGMTNSRAGICGINRALSSTS